MSKDIRVRYAPSPTGLLSLHIGGMPVQHCSTIFTHVIMVELLLSVLEDTDRKRHVEDGERSQLETRYWR